MEETVAASFARALRDLAVSSGAEPAELDRRSGIDADRLIDADARIPLEQYKALMRSGQELSGDLALALHFGEAAELSELSIVGLMGEAFESFGEAFEGLSRYLRLAIDVELEEGAKGQRLALKRSGRDSWLVDTRKRPNDFPEITESAFARMVTVARRFGKVDLVTAVHMTHPAPPYLREYQRIFPVAVTFNSHWNAIRLKDDSWAALRPRMPSSYMSELLRGRADALLDELDVVPSTRAAVEKALLSGLANGDAGMDHIAAELGLSRTSLFRRLREERTSYRQVLAALRARLAEEYLVRECLSVAESSNLLGFSDQASFSRALKRWTGKSPRQFARGGCHLSQRS
jgi:AraC-like DNA-binding protein